MPDTRKDSSRRDLKSWVPLVLFIVVVVMTYFWVWKHGRYRVIRVGIPDTQTSKFLQAVLENWNVREMGGIEIHAIPLSYDQLFEAESNGGAQLDASMIDDPWLPQLVEEKRLAAVPRDREHDFDRFIRKLRGEFLRVAYYRESSRTSHPPAPSLADQGDLPGRPALADLPQADRKGYTLYALPYVGNVQVLLRHKAQTGEDKLSRTLAAGADWAALEGTLGNTPFYTRIGSNNSALADFLPLLWSVGGCLLTRDGKTEVAGFRDHAAAVKALTLSLRLARGQIQHARFQDEDVQTHLLGMPDTVGITWLAFASREPRYRRDVQWSSMPAIVVKPGSSAEENVLKDCRSGEEGVPSAKPALLGTWLLAVNENAQYKDDVWRFVWWALEQVANPCGNSDLEFTRRPCNAPPDKNSPGDDDLLTNDPLNGFPTPFDEQMTDLARDAVSHSKARPANPKWRQIEDAAGFRIRQAHWGTLKPEPAIACAERDINNILRGNESEAAGCEHTDDTR